MGFTATPAQMDALFALWQTDYDIYAPKLFPSGGRFSDTDVVRYGKVHSAAEIVYDRKSLYSFKEVLTPISETLFFFTESECRISDGPKKGAVIFLRSCDLHAVKRLDDMYLRNGEPDYYYDRIRENVHFVLMGCPDSFDSCFCVSMGTSRSDQYEMAVNFREGFFEVDSRVDQWSDTLKKAGAVESEVRPDFVTENRITVKVPENLDCRVGKSRMWDQYDSRCVNCGRCNFVCPTCTCWSMQDIFYTDNGKAGERRRVTASCMVDGFTDVAGGASYRKKNGERMRFKTLHKVLDFRSRTGYNMCVGCGRCDDVCPEYISFSSIINHLGDGMKEVTGDDSQE